MVRNRDCENSDGCTAAVLERVVVNLRPKRKETGMATLAPGFREEKTLADFVAETDLKGVASGSGTYPAFEVGGWQFTVKTLDRQLIGDLKDFCREISGHPRADRKFTFKLVRCTEQGRLGGWAWQKERVQVH